MSQEEIAANADSWTPLTSPPLPNLDSLPNIDSFSETTEQVPRLLLSVHVNRNCHQPFTISHAHKARALLAVELH